MFSRPPLGGNDDCCEARGERGAQEVFCRLAGADWPSPLPSAQPLTGRGAAADPDHAPHFGGQIIEPDLSPRPGQTVGAHRQTHQPLLTRKDVFHL